MDQWQAYRALAAELGDPQLAETVASVRPQAGLSLSCCYNLQKHGVFLVVLNFVKLQLWLWLLYPLLFKVSKSLFCFSSKL